MNERKDRDPRPLEWHETPPQPTRNMTIEEQFADYQARLTAGGIVAKPEAYFKAGYLFGSCKNTKDAAKYRALHTPEIQDFMLAIEREALHQRERWGSSGDAGKTDADWFWLIGYLAGKAIRPDASPEKRLHHIITAASALLNWHAAKIGAYAAMRPGIDPQEGAE